MRGAWPARGPGPEPPLNNLSDIELVAMVRERQPAALAALYDRYASSVHGLARAILRDPRLAEEVTHDVFLHLWQDPHAFVPSRGPFPGWLLRVARNRAIDVVRRRREQPFLVTLTDSGETLDPASLLVDPDPDPADQAVTQAMRQDVRRALANLTPDHRRLLEMAYFGGMTQREIAEHVNRPLGTVKTQIRAAMQRMADLLRVPAALPGDDHWREEPAVRCGRGGADPQ
ncbi:MAG: DNA-directed RNA polymerase sigma-70 factor [Thermomicrobiales bacterium]|nr:MAG: DNA-directed RNA polymerase sigma-70 factor [Thermomicrobiales bacterium]